ncbi:mycobacterial cell wall protein Rv0580c [Mycobacterium sp. MUNTM1]
MGLLLRSPLAGLARNQFMVLSFTGRKTGRPYSIPLSAHLIDGRLYALTSAGWKQNFRGAAPVQVVYDGKTTAMRGELIRDRGVVSDLLSRCAESYGVQRAQRMIGLKFRDQHIPTRDEFAEAVDRLHLGAVRLSPAD